SNGFQLEHLTGKLRTQPIMQVTPQTSAFIFTSAHDALTRSAHVIRELDSADSGRCKGGYGRQELLFIPIEPLLRPSWGDNQPSDTLLLVDKRYRLHIIGGFAPYRDWFLLVSSGRRRDSDVGNLEQMGDGLYQVRQDGARRIGGLQVMRQARQYRRRVVSLAVHHPVDAALETIAQGLEQHGDDSRGE